MRRLGQVVSAISIWALSLTIGCGNFWVYPGSTSSSTGGSGDYVYVANGSTTLAGFSISSGSLTALTGSPFSLGYDPTAAAVNPADTILFLGSNAAIYAYSINASTGALSVMNSGNAVGLATVNAMAISPDGNWLIALSVIGSGVILEQFQINSTTGVLTQFSPSSYTTPVVPTPRAIKFSPNGDYLLIALGTAGDLVYSFNTSTSSGALSNPIYTGALTAPLNDSALATGSTDTIFYVARANSTSAGSVVEYSIGSGGTALTDVGSIAAGVQPYAMVVNKAGTDLYVANQSNNSISGYSIASSSGVLAAISTSPYTSGLGSDPSALAVDQSGDYLLAASLGGSPYLSMYSYDATTPGQLDASTSTSAGIIAPVAIAATH
jgi:6-phosphogluconolactonase (cycloisomerase 2 family)